MTCVWYWMRWHMRLSWKFLMVEQPAAAKKAMQNLQTNKFLWAFQCLVVSLPPTRFLILQELWSVLLHKQSSCRKDNPFLPMLIKKLFSLHPITEVVKEQSLSGNQVLRYSLKLTWRQLIWSLSVLTGRLYLWWKCEAKKNSQTEAGHVSEEEMKSLQTAIRA